MNLNHGKYLGVDYGDVRTGLAECDLSGSLAGGIGTISEGGMKNTALAVAVVTLAYLVYVYLFFTALNNSSRRIDSKAYNRCDNELVAEDYNNGEQRHVSADKNGYHLVRG